MAESINMAGRIEEQMPAKLVDFIKAAGRVAQRQQQRLYLVGGVVRDLLLGRDTLDLDLVVEGDAINLAQKLAGIIQAKVTIHTRFGTAKLQGNNRSIDVATARAESYARPGALPTVKPGTARNDLARRDFTINAMAIELNPSHFGRLLDPHGGKQDLEHKLVRVLHERSFIDDATRIWRALRYEQRLDFQIEPATLELLKRDITMLATISGDRIRNELELILKEELPEKVLLRADELGVLNKLHPSVKADAWLVETFVLARRQYPDSLSPRLYLALLAYHLNADENEQLISYLKLPRASAQVMRDTIAIKDKIGELSVNGLAPSRIYALLHGYSSIALTANSLATDSTTVEEHIGLYQNVLRYVQPALTGEDVKRLGIPEGPKIKEILQSLRQARLNGKVSSKKEEEKMVRGWKTNTRLGGHLNEQG
jgi:tRNA nucleotidyltransferase (CCA-adding enzyme)